MSLDDIFVQPTPSVEDVPAAAVPHYASCLAPLLEQFLSSGSLDDLKLFLVTWITLVRPIGKQRSAANAIIRRCQLLSTGNHLEQLYNEICPQRANRHARSQPHQTIESHTNVNPPASPVSDTHAWARRRATKLGCLGLLRQARSALGISAPLGAFTHDDVTAYGPLSETLTACPGSVVAEMLQKHPAPITPPPTLDDLLSTVPSQDGSPVTRAHLADLVDETFGGLPPFRKYVASLFSKRRSMPACDGIRFDHF